MNNELEQFTPEEFKIAYDKIYKNITKNKIIETNKKAIVLGGQPGAGKSSLIKKFAGELNHNVVIINADEFRKHHPRFNEIEQDSLSRNSADPRSNSSTRTGEWSGKMSEAILRKSVENGYNVIIEGTFRTTEIPIKTLTGLKENNYQTTVAIKTCPKEESYQSTIDRYENEKRLNGYGRLTPKEHHFKVVENLAQNAEKVYKSNLADRFYVESRNGVLFDSKINQNQFTSSIIQNELNGNKQTINNDLFGKARIQAQEKIKTQEKVSLPNKKNITKGR